MKYMVITEIMENNHSEYWYYGTYDHDTANEVAYELGHHDNIYHIVIPAEEAMEWEVKNLPM